MSHAGKRLTMREVAEDDESTRARTAPGLGRSPDYSLQQEARQVRERMSPPRATAPPEGASPLPHVPTQAISLRNVTKYFYKGDARITALASITFDVRPGSFVSIIGPSGCGK